MLWDPLERRKRGRFRKVFRDGIKSTMSQRKLFIRQKTLAIGMRKTTFKLIYIMSKWLRDIYYYTMS